MAGQIKVEMTADQAKLFKEFQKQQREIDKLKAGYKDLGRTGKRATDKAQKGFEKQNSVIAKTKKSLLGMASTYAGVGTAIAGVAAVLKDMKERQDEAIRGARQLIDVRGSLAQISESADQFSARRQRAQKIAGRTLLSEKQATSLLFSGISEGFEPDVSYIARLAPLIKPKPGARLAGQVPTLFGGRISSRQSVAAGIIASGQSRLNAGQLADVLPAAAEGATGKPGASPAETFGSLSVFANLFGSVSTAADRLKAFGLRLGLDKRFEGKGFIKSVRMLRNMPEAKRQEFLGESQELNTAFNKFSANLGEIVSRTQEVKSAIGNVGTPQSPVQQRLRTRLSDPQVRSQIALAGAESSLSITERKEISTKGAFARAAVRDVEAATIREGLIGQPTLAKTLGEILITARGGRRAAATASYVGSQTTFSSILDATTALHKLIRFLKTGETDERLEAAVSGATTIEEERELLEQKRELLEMERDVAEKQRQAAEKQAGDTSGRRPDEDI